ncbi:MAG TPA: hypothetical protein VIX17_11195 [Pyrinomonadaceae bacterium]|jgi:hypothetical protein
MTKSKIAKGLFIFAGVLWLTAGIRDLLAPGFFSISGRTVTTTGIVIDFALGIFFLMMSGTVARQYAEREQKTRQGVAPNNGMQPVDSQFNSRDDDH